SQPDPGNTEPKGGYQHHNAQRSHKQPSPPRSALRSGGAGRGSRWAFAEPSLSTTEVAPLPLGSALVEFDPLLCSAVSGTSHQEEELDRRARRYGLGNSATPPLRPGRQTSAQRARAISASVCRPPKQARATRCGVDIGSNPSFGLEITAD